MTVQLEDPVIVRAVTYYQAASYGFTEYSLGDVLERLYQNQLALEAAVMELTLWIERKGTTDTGDNVCGALQTIGENAGHIKQGLAKLKARGPH